MSKIHVKTGGVCPVCCSDIEDDGIVLHKTRRQTHRLCVKCGIQYLTPLVNLALSNLRRGMRDDAMQYIMCTGTYHGQLRNHCRHKVMIHNITVPRDRSLHTSIFTLLSILSKPNSYLCPRETCWEIIVTHPDDPILHTECTKCRYNWCRSCQVSPYHDSMSCVMYEATQQSTDLGKYMNEKIERGDVKPCPRCNTPIEKARDSDGNFIACNRMHCLQCGIAWCWLCGVPGIDYDHYNEKNAQKCANKLWEGTTHGR